MSLLIQFNERITRIVTVIEDEIYDLFIFIVMYVNWIQINI